MSGDRTKIGALGSLASSIQSRYAIFPSSLSEADNAYNQALKDATGSAAATAALGENTLSGSQTRMRGIDQLREQLSSAKDPKDVMDLQALIAVEQAQLQNDMLPYCVGVVEGRLIATRRDLRHADRQIALETAASFLGFPSLAAAKLWLTDYVNRS